ncbi:MAG: glycoside hydrolase [Actinomycetota bacterium]|nr:glycoside hydrolase [Actinomycetota bacterium]
MFRRNIVVVAAAVVGLLAVPGGAGAQEGTDSVGFVVEAPRQVTMDPKPLRLYVQPQIAVHPDDPSIVAMAVGEARDGGCPLTVSRDGGLSWSITARTLMPDDLPFCVQRNYGPVLGMAFASNGRLYVGMSGSSSKTDPPHPNGPITALIARTDDLGATHETFVVAEPKPVTYTPEPQPTDAASPPAVPEVTATPSPATASPTSPTPTSPTGASPAAVPTQSPAAGATSPGAAPATQTGFDQHRLNSIAVDPDNPDKVYRAWRQGVGGLLNVPFGAVPLRSMIAVSEDGGKTWGEPIDVADSFQGDKEIFGSDVPMLVVDPDGTVFGFAKERPRRAAEGQPTAVSRLFMFKSTDGGKSWATSEFSPGAEDLDNPAAAIDPNSGNLYVVYSSRGERSDDEEPENPSELYFLASTDGGETWSEPVDVSDDDPERGADQYHPGISVAPNGRIDLAWHDFRNDPFFTPRRVGDMGVEQRYWDAYYASSTNAGATWSPNTRVTNPSIDGKLGTTFSNNDIRGPMGIASTEEAAYVTWSDSRATGADATDAEDAYFSRIRYAAVPALGAAGGGSSNLLWSLLGAGAALALAGLAFMAWTRLTRGRSRPESGGRLTPAAT